MRKGMLWFDNSKTAIETKVAKAAEYFEKKYGFKPDLCLLHPSMLSQQPSPEIAGLEVRPYRPILPGHIWIGVADKE